MKVLTLMLLLTFLLPRTTVFAATETPQCPQEISVKQTITAEAAGWKAEASPSRYPLITVQFSVGPPSEEAFLLPSEENGEGFSTWRFQPQQETLWVSCGYNNTSVILSRQLPLTVTKCQVKYDTSFTPPVATAYTCE